MLKELELLAPAGNKDIGIAAVDCGADAVYIAGPSFGAREAAGNNLNDIAELVRYARRFGVNVYVTVNTILKENELEQARKLITDCYEAGCDAVIIQDLGILEMELPPIKLFASTQCNIRTPEQARWLESLGFDRLILARELSLEEIRQIRSAVKCDLETFVHGALCVSYSGQCYMSCHLTGRSANRGACIQACRSRYDVLDGSGNVLLRDRAVLSLKDLNLAGRVPDLISAGVTSFKIEGRLKNASYVKNAVRMYRGVIDDCLSGNMGAEYRHSSFGFIEGGFNPAPEATFSRGFTEFFIDGERGLWSSMDTAKGIGECVGKVKRVVSANARTMKFELDGSILLHNGDGLCFRGADGEVIGVRADVVSGGIVEIKAVKGLKAGTSVYRNFNIAFEKELANNTPKRLLKVEVIFGEHSVKAEAEDGRTVECPIGEYLPADNREFAERNIRAQLGKTVPPYSFTVVSVPSGCLPFMPASALNALRRELARRLDEQRNTVSGDGYAVGKAMDRVTAVIPPVQNVRLNCANSLAGKVYAKAGLKPQTAFELTRDASGEYSELMRTKYCLRHELGLCPKQKKGEKALPLYLMNQGKKFKVSFVCSSCENVISQERQ